VVLKCYHSIFLFFSPAGLPRAMRQAELDWVHSLIEEIRGGRIAWQVPPACRTFIDGPSPVGGAEGAAPAKP